MSTEPRAGRGVQEWRMPYDDAEGTPLLAGQRLVRHSLAVSSEDLRRRHRGDDAHRELADHVDRLARQVDLLDDQMRSKAVSIRDRLAPLASGNHHGVDTNGVLRLGATDLEVLGIQYAQSLDTLEQAVLAYQRSVPAWPPADRAAAAKSRRALHGSSPVPASVNTTGETHHRRDRAAPRH